MRKEEKYREQHDALGSSRPGGPGPSMTQGVDDLLSHVAKLVDMHVAARDRLQRINLATSEVRGWQPPLPPLPIPLSGTGERLDQRTVSKIRKELSLIANRNARLPANAHQHNVDALREIRRQLDYWRALSGSDATAAPSAKAPDQNTAP